MSRAIAGNHDLTTSHANNLTIFGSHHDLPRIKCGGPFHARAHYRRFRIEQRYCLTLHVGSHQGPVGIIMFQEGNQSGRNAHDLFRRNVHVIHFFTVLNEKVLVATNGDTVIHELPMRSDLRISLSNRVLVLFICRQVLNFIGRYRRNRDPCQRQSGNSFSQLCIDSIPRFCHHFSTLRIHELLP